MSPSDQLRRVRTVAKVCISRSMIKFYVFSTLLLWNITVCATFHTVLNGEEKKTLLLFLGYSMASRNYFLASKDGLVTTHVQYATTIYGHTTKGF